MISIDTSRLETIEDQQLIYEVVQSHFSLFLTDEKDLLISLMTLFSQNNPVFVQAGQYEMLLNTKAKVAISGDFVQVMDYFVYAHIRTDINISFECSPINFFDYHLLQQKLKQQGAIEYSLTSLMWQIYSQVLPKDLVAHDTRWLKLKTTELPDFKIIGAVPDYIPKVILHCMKEGKTLAELNADFPSVTAVKLNRLLLLCILIGVVDLQVLYSSHKYNQQPLNKTSFFGTHSQEGLNNTAINSDASHKNSEQASKFGFFSRLLGIK